MNATLPKTKLTHADPWALPVNIPPDATLVLCETAAHIQQALRSPGSPQDTLVALMPEAAVECRLQGRTYLKLEDCFDETVLCALSEPLLVAQSAWADVLDEWLWHTVPEFRAAEFRPARWYIFFLKILSDELLLRSLALAHLFTAAPGARYFAFAETRPVNLQSNLFFNESVYQLILPLCTAAYGVALTTYPKLSTTKLSTQATTPQPPTRLMEAAKGLLPASLLAQTRMWRDLGGTAYWRNCWRRTATPHLLYKHGFDVSSVARAAALQDWRCTEVSSLYAQWQRPLPNLESVRQSLQVIWGQFTQNPELLAPFQWVGVNLWPAVENRMHYWWREVVPHMWQIFQRARAHFADQPPTVCLIATPWEIEDHVLLHAARASGIPCVTYQHGGFEGSCEYIMHDLTDLRYSDYRMVYGLENAAYVESRRQRYLETRAQPLTIGSTRLATLTRSNARHRRQVIRRRLGIKPDWPLVLYIPTMYMRYQRYLACQDNGDVSYLELQAQVAQIMREFPDVQFVYKTFPSGLPDPVLRLLAAYCPNCRVETQIPLTELLWAADAHMLDIPSTGMLEAMLTPKPMLVLADAQHIQLQPEARRMLQKRVWLAETPNDFTTALRQFLVKQQYAELTAPDDEFLRAFGLPQNDGHSAERAVEALRMFWPSSAVAPAPHRANA